MNNTNKLLAAFVVVALAFAVLPTSSAQNAGGDYGSQVLESDNEFRPDLELGADIDIGSVGVLRHDGPDASSFTDDIFLLDLDEDDDISQFDYVLATGGYGGRDVGELIETGDIQLTSLDFTDRDAIVVYADVNENGFYDMGDYVYITSAASGDGDLAATAVGAASGAFTIRLTPNPSGGFGSLVRTTHDDFRDYGTDGVSENWSDFSLPGVDAAEFAFYDSENDGEFEGGSDRAYIVGQGNVTAGAAVPLYSIVIFGGELGHQVEIGGADWSPTVMEIGALTTLDVVRYDPGTPDDSLDDVFALNLDGTDDIDQYDLILATGGYDNSNVGDAVGLDQTLLRGNGGAAVATEVFWADVDQNTVWNDGDYLWICDDGGTSVHRTTATAFCIRLTDTDGGEAGTLVLTGDDDLINWRDETSAAFDASAEACFFDSDSDGTFDAGEDLLWIFLSGCDDGDLLDLYSIVLFGGAFGSIVGLDDNNFVPSVQDVALGAISAGTAAVIRYDAGTNNDFTDDVFGLDLDGDGSAFEQYDLIIASGANFGGRGAGDLVAVGDQLLIGKGSVEAADVYFVDVNENGYYDEGDWVVICSDGHGFAPTSTSEFCIRMTDTDDGEAGTIVRTGDDDWDRWAAQAMAFAGDAPEIVFYDTDNDGAFQGEGDGDLLFLSPVDIADGARVPLFSLRLYGDFSIVPPSGGTTTTTTTTSGTTTTTTTTTDGSTDTTTTTTETTPTDTTTTTSPGATTTTTDGTGTDTTTTPTDGEGDSPAFGVFALIAALGAALVLVRRKL